MSLYRELEGAGSENERLKARVAELEDMLARERAVRSPHTPYAQCLQAYNSFGCQCLYRDMTTLP